MTLRTLQLRERTSAAAGKLVPWNASKVRMRANPEIVRSLLLEGSCRLSLFTSSAPYFSRLAHIRSAHSPSGSCPTTGAHPLAAPTEARTRVHRRCRGPGGARARGARLVLSCARTLMRIGAHTHHAHPCPCVAAVSLLVVAAESRADRGQVASARTTKRPSLQKCTTSKWKRNGAATSSC